MSQLWKHTSLNISKKLEVFQAVVASALLPGLATTWLNSRQQRQIDGFQARCLRDILKIPHPMYSRVSNANVLAQSGHKAFTIQLRRRQLLLFGRVARAPEEDLRRKLTFCSNSLRPATYKYVRRVGRPRLEWAQKLLEVAIATWGPEHKIKQLVMDENVWSHEVAKHF